MDDILDIQRHKPIYISEGWSLAYVVPGGLMLFCCGIFGATFHNSDEMVLGWVFFLLALVGLFMMFLRTGVVVFPSNIWGTYFGMFGFKAIRKKIIAPTTTHFELKSMKEQRTYNSGFESFHSSSSLSTSYEVKSCENEKAILLHEFMDYQVAYKFLEAIAEAHQLPAMDHVHEARKSALKRRRFRRR